jgi:hypothetical protein
MKRKRVLIASLMVFLTVAGLAWGTQETLSILGTPVYFNSSGFMLSPAPGKPDALIKNADELAYIGDNVYNLDGQHQTKEQGIAAGETAVYWIKIQNDVEGRQSQDNITVRGDNDTLGWTLAYVDIQEGSDITQAVTTTGWATGMLEEHDERQIKLEVTAPGDGSLGDSIAILVSVQSQNDGSARDAVLAITSISGSTGVEESSQAEFSLQVPEMVSGNLTLNYTAPIAGHVTIAVYDVLGRRVNTVFSEQTKAGTYSTTWNSTDSKGKPVPAGIYFCSMKTDSFIRTVKFVLVD